MNPPLEYCLDLGYTTYKHFPIMTKSLKFNKTKTVFIVFNAQTLQPKAVC